MAIQRQISIALIAAAAAAFGAAVTWADVPGYLFMDIENNHALVVQPKAPDAAKARIFKQPTAIPDDLASGIIAGAQPIGDCIIVAYQGKLYMVPDKKQGEHMASHMVMRAAGAKVD